MRDSALFIFLRYYNAIPVHRDFSGHMNVTYDLVRKCALQYFLKTGTCKYGSTCKYHHPRDRRGAAPVSFNALGLPMRQVCTSLGSCNSCLLQTDYCYRVGRRSGSYCIYSTFFYSCF